MTKDTSGPAFPQPCQAEGYAANSVFGIAGGGVTKREWYAGMALSAIRVGDWADCKDGAAWCFAYADAMLAASEQEKP